MKVQHAAGVFPRSCAIGSVSFLASSDRVFLSLGRSELLGAQVAQGTVWTFFIVVGTPCIAFLGDDGLRTRRETSIFRTQLVLKDFHHWLIVAARQVWGFNPAARTALGRSPRLAETAFERARWGLWRGCSVWQLWSASPGGRDTNRCTTPLHCTVILLGGDQRRHPPSSRSVPERAGQMF